MATSAIPTAAPAHWATPDARGTRRLAGGLFLVAALGFAAAATVLSATFDWPDILREPADVVLASFADGGAGLVWTWFATGWTYGLLLVPILLLPAALGRRDDPVLRAATWVGAASVVLAVAGFLRWVFVVPSLSRMYADGDGVTRSAVDAAWLVQHQFGGTLLGEHLGQVLAIGWSTAVCVVILRGRLLPAAVGWLGLVASAVYLVNQGDILATAVPDVPVWEPAGFLGSTLWGLWIAALGITLLRRPAA